MATHTDPLTVASITPSHPRALCVLLAAAAGGTYAIPTSSVTASPHAITWAGTINLAAGQTNDAATGATNIAPGDLISREVELSDTQGSVANKEITLKLTASPASLLDSDPTNGLQVSIQQCSRARTRNVVDPSSPAFQYTCAPGRSTVNIDGAASASVRALEAHAGTLTPLTFRSSPGNDFLVLTFVLPVSSPGDLTKVPACSGTPGGNDSTENLQGCSSTLTYTFRVTQPTPIGP